MSVSACLVAIVVRLCSINTSRTARAPGPDGRGDGDVPRITLCATPQRHHFWLSGTGNGRLTERPNADGPCPAAPGDCGQLGIPLTHRATTGGSRLSIAPI